MDIKKVAKDGLESRVNKLENFIANRGLGSAYLSRAKKIQRNVNITIVMGIAITITGISIWALNKLNED
jgi:hypothetical protein